MVNAAGLVQAFVRRPSVSRKEQNLCGVQEVKRKKFKLKKIMLKVS